MAVWSACASMSETLLDDDDQLSIEHIETKACMRTYQLLDPPWGFRRCHTCRPMRGNAS